MRTFNIGETVTVPRFVRGEIVGHVTGTVTDHYPGTDPYYLIRVQDRHVGHYPHEMTRPGEPRHLSDAPADSGASATAPRTDPAHSPSTVPTYTDPWAGNPDTDKFWSK